MSRRSYWDILTGLLAVAALVVAAVTVRDKLKNSANSVTVPRASIQKDWKRYAVSESVLGNPDAVVTVVEFSDFLCPFCQRLPAYIDSLRTLGKDVRVLYRHFPSASRKHAVAAVRASECALAQGSFSAMHRSLTEYADSIGVAAWKWFSEISNVPDGAEFEACTSSSSPIPALARDTVAGRELAIRGTPTILVNEHRYNGLPPFDSLVAYVERAQRSASTR
jgi:protein-disulfide isomerase